jgi:hypothetical protein
MDVAAGGAGAAAGSAHPARQANKSASNTIQTRFMVFLLVGLLAPSGRRQFIA